MEYGKESIFILQINNLIEIILNLSHMLTEQNLHLQVESDVNPLQFQTNIMQPVNSIKQSTFLIHL